MLGTEALYTAKQTRALDAYAIDECGIPGLTLMSRAAAATLEHLLELWPAPEQLQILCGTGNNGGDGFLIADLAHKRGIAVLVYQVGDAAKICADALVAREQAVANGVKIVACAAIATEGLSDTGVIVDAVLGTGLGGEVRPEAVQAIAAMNASAAPVVAVDIPSGLCADTGAVLGAAVCADLTVTFIGLKRGLFTFAAPDCTGDIQVCDLGVPLEAYQAVLSSCSRLELETLLEELPERPATAHKGLYGTVLIVGGDYGMAGAVAMAAEAALRCGAGLVRVATRPEHVAPVIARTPEAMPVGVADSAALAALLEAADVVVIGPGLGQTDWALQLTEAVLAADKPTVIDADALNLIASGKVKISNATNPRLLTPHPGEAARLLGVSNAAVQADRFAAVAQLQSRFGSTVILKGNGTLIAGTDESGTNQILLSDYGNPGMASGGMGDVLSGVLGALLSQRLDPLIAGALGTCLHSAAADIAAADGERGLLATDLLQPMRELLG